MRQVRLWRRLVVVSAVAQHTNPAFTFHDCRKLITPEQEEEDMKESAQTLVEQCTCSSGASCDLSKEDHEFIAKYAAREKK